LLPYILVNKPSFLDNFKLSERERRLMNGAVAKCNDFYMYFVCILYIVANADPIIRRTFMKKIVTFIIDS